MASNERTGGGAEGRGGNSPQSFAESRRRSCNSVAVDDTNAFLSGRSGALTLKGPVNAKIYVNKSRSRNAFDASSVPSGGVCFPLLMPPLPCPPPPDSPTVVAPKVAWKKSWPGR